MTTSRVAVTGASGHVGSRLIRTLREHPDISNLLGIDVRPWKGPVDDRTQFFRLDVCSDALPDLLKRARVDTVLHLAVAQRDVLDPERMHEINVIGTLNVLRACQAAGVRRLIATSSTAVYGFRPDNPLYMTENHPVRPNQDLPYARDKAEMERVIRAVADKRTNIKVTILRPAMTLGSGVFSLLSPFLEKRHAPYLLGFDPLVQLLSLKDLNRGLLAALMSDADGTFNLVGKGVLPYSHALHQTGRLPVPIPSARLAHVGFSALWYLRMAQSSPGAVGLLRYPLLASGDRARDELGFEPQDDATACLAQAMARQTPQREVGNARDDTLLEVLRDYSTGREKLEIDKMRTALRRGVLRVDREGRGEEDRVSQRKGR